MVIELVLGAVNWVGMTLFVLLYLGDSITFSAFFAKLKGEWVIKL